MGQVGLGLFSDPTVYMMGWLLIMLSLVKETPELISKPPIIHLWIFSLAFLGGPEKNTQHCPPLPCGCPTSSPRQVIVLSPAESQYLTPEFYLL